MCGGACTAAVRVVVSRLRRSDHALHRMDLASHTWSVLFPNCVEENSHLAACAQAWPSNSSSLPGPSAPVYWSGLRGVGLGFQNSAVAKNHPVLGSGFFIFGGRQWRMSCEMVPHFPGASYSTLDALFAFTLWVRLGSHSLPVAAELYFFAMDPNGGYGNWTLIPHVGAENTDAMGVIFNGFAYSAEANAVFFTGGLFQNIQNPSFLEFADGLMYRVDLAPIAADMPALLTAVALIDETPRVACSIVNLPDGDMLVVGRLLVIPLEWWGDNTQDEFSHLYEFGSGFYLPMQRGPVRFNPVDSTRWLATPGAPSTTEPVDGVYSAHFVLSDGTTPTYLLSLFGAWYSGVEVYLRYVAHGHAAFA